MISHLIVSTFTPVNSIVICAGLLVILKGIRVNRRIQASLVDFEQK
ncbi:MAG: hypothetical protein ACD_74C00158G0008 [uncultured bacterium]|nr:MAG: hypothetical protein ACD_74C00158G0008 [uncultured bacterium]